MLIYASLLYVKSAPAAFYTLIYAPYEHRQVPPQIPHHVACYQHNKGYFLTNYKTGALLRTMARPRARCSQRRAATGAAAVTRPRGASRDSVLTNDVHYYVRGALHYSLYCALHDLLYSLNLFVCYVYAATRHTTRCSSSRGDSAACERTRSCGTFVICATHPMPRAWGRGVRQ